LTKEEILRIVLGQARQHGFEFRKWFLERIRPEWPGSKAAVELLATESRYYALIFSHEFAQTFWKQGQMIQFVVPMDSYKRRNAKGEIIEVKRKAFTRRTAKPDVWRYHLGKMAEADEPLLYLRKFLMIEEDLKAGGVRAGTVNLAAQADK
jgi:hypothetical protein